MRLFQQTPILNANVCLAISTPVFVELSCPRQKGDSRTANFIAKFAINIDIESLLRLVGCKYLIISYHWINYERESEEIITKTLKGLHFLKFLGLPKKKRFAISSDH